MSTSHAPHKNSGARQTSTVRHSKSDALNDREYELLLQGANAIDDPYYRLQCRFVVLAAGRLGLRAGEIAHMDESWIDWRRNRIEVPRYDPCRKGRDGGICGYCAQQRDQMLEHNPDMERAEATAMMWQAKTAKAARGIPFDFSARCELVVEEFFDRFQEWPLSRQGVNRRVNRAAEHAQEVDVDDVYPHALRATACTWHAGRGLSVLPMKSFFGWSKLQTAQNYIASSDENTARAVRATHSR